MNWTKICDLTDIPENTGVCALIDGKQVAIFSIKKTLYAIDNFDPIGQANVLSRGIVGDINGKLVVASPLYKQHFSLQTGQCLEEEAVKITSYDIRQNGDYVEINMNAEARAA